jgi:hypothetical protein
MKTAEHPFQFVTASYLTRIGNCRVANLAELSEGLGKCSDASIFYHTFQTLSRHHFLTEGFSNDFAQWVLTACNRAELAEQLASIDIRDYLFLAELRADLHRVAEDYIANNPLYANQEAFEPFFFCDAIEVSVPLGVEAWTLEDFRRGLERLSHASFHYHFVASRLRLHLRTNDFSHWLETSLGLDALAQKVNRIDIYTNTLESAREKMAAMIDGGLAQ